MRSIRLVVPLWATIWRTKVAQSDADGCGLLTGADPVLILVYSHASRVNFESARMKMTRSRFESVCFGEG
jgi:hypothetical protein